jgi:isoleucyl-tRNA synthetase
MVQMFGMKKKLKIYYLKGFTHPGSPNGMFRKETDIMDVWFDSGTSHAVLESRNLTLSS